MTDQYVGEIRMLACNFAPNGWALCNGQLLPISQNTALFSLLGTSYGGDGKSTFALPNLQGRVATSFGSGALGTLGLGDQGGAETVTITAAEMPAHAHAWLVNDAGSEGEVQGAEKSGILGRGQRTAFVANEKLEPNAPLDPSTIGTNPGPGALPHQNMMPYLAVTFVIALVGIFPPRS